MRTSLFTLLLFISFFSAPCQQKQAASLLINRVWEIRYDGMIGIGVHHSVPDKTTIEFLGDHTWKSSLPINNSTSGKWAIDDDDETLSLFFRNTEVKYSIVKLDEKTLRYQRSILTARYITAWHSQ